MTKTNTETLQNKYRYINDYKSRHLKRFIFELRKDEDAAIIEHLQKQPSKNAYIKALIIKDMEK